MDTALLSVPCFEMGALRADDWNEPMRPVKVEHHMCSPVQISKRRLPRGFRHGLGFYFDANRKPKGGDVGLVKTKGGRKYFGRIILGPHDQLVCIQPLNRHLAPAFVAMSRVVGMYRCNGIMINDTHLPVSAATQRRIDAMFLPMGGSNARFKDAMRIVGEFEHWRIEEAKKSSGTPDRNHATPASNGMKIGEAMAAVA